MKSHAATLADRLAGKAPMAVAVPHEKSRDRPAPPTLTLTSMGDFLAEADETLDWLVEDRIPAGSVCLLVAKPKTGKSTLARDLAVAVARGESWLGHQCHAGVVWYLAFEGRKRDARAHFRQMGCTREDPIWSYMGSAPKDIVRRVQARAAIERPALVVIDTMQRFLRPRSTDDYSEMSGAFDPILAIARESGATLLLLHHAGKADRASIDAVLGSTAIAGSADNVIMLTRTARYRTIATTQRVGDDLTECVLLMDGETGRLRLGGSRELADRAFIAEELLRILRAAHGGLTQREWFEQVEARRTVKLAALRILTERGNQIQREGPGTRNEPYRYRLINASSESDSSSQVPLRDGNLNLSSSSSGTLPIDSRAVSSSRVPAQGPSTGTGNVNPDESDDGGCY